jgi:hypothetical protein
MRLADADPLTISDPSEPKLVGILASGAAQQGAAVVLSADGNMAIVGGPSDNNGQGAVWVYTRSGAVWTQQGPKLVGPGASSQFGSSVSLYADGTAIVGGPGENNGLGASKWAKKSRTALLDHLAYTERHIRDGERHLLRQREIVDELERHGRGRTRRQETRVTFWKHLKRHSQCISMTGRISY